MAEEKKTPAKVEESKLTKVLNWFKTLPGRIAKPFKNMVAELKKVTWPSKKKWISSSVMVLVFMLFMGVVIGLLDLGATALVNTMIGNTADTAVTETTETPVDETVDGTVEATEAPAAEATEVPAE
jgi:preprotein translocase subunit SecE